MFSCTGLSPSTATPSRGLPLATPLAHSPPFRQKWLDRPTTPTAQPLPGLTCDRFGLLRFRSPLLTESRLFSLPVGTEMFHFPTFPPPALCVQAGVTGHDSSRVSPFGNPRIKAWLTTPRGLSRPPTSFIGSWCQGIHRAPLKTWPQMLASTVQFSNNDQPPITPPFTGECTGAGIEGTSFPQTPNSVPGTSLHHPVFHAEAVLTGSLENAPTNQRSTHEQPAPDTRRCTGP